MKSPLRIPTFWSLLIAVGLTSAARGTDQEGLQLPKLDEQSAKGLQIECRLTKTDFAIGEPVNMWCTIKNTTDNIKPIIWHPSSGDRFCCVRSESTSFAGVLPLVIPQIHDNPLLIKSQELGPGYILYIPPHKSLQLLLTYKAERPEKFKGNIVYDPVTRGGGYFGKEAEEKARSEWVYSNTFEYEVGAAEQK